MEPCTSIHSLLPFWLPTRDAKWGQKITAAIIFWAEYLILWTKVLRQRKKQKHIGRFNKRSLSPWGALEKLVRIKNNFSLCNAIFSVAQASLIAICVIISEGFVEYCCFNGHLANVWWESLLIWRCVKLIMLFWPLVTFCYWCFMSIYDSAFCRFYWDILGDLFTFISCYRGYDISFVMITL